MDYVKYTKACAPGRLERIVDGSLDSVENINQKLRDYMNVIQTHRQIFGILLDFSRCQYFQRRTNLTKANLF